MTHADEESLNLCSHKIASTRIVNFKRKKYWFVLPLWWVVNAYPVRTLSSMRMVCVVFFSVLYPGFSSIAQSRYQYWWKEGEKERRRKVQKEGRREEASPCGPTMQTRPPQTTFRYILNGRSSYSSFCILMRRKKVLIPWEHTLPLSHDQEARFDHSLEDSFPSIRM